MKMIFETVKFDVVLFFKSPRFIIPLLANIIFLFFMYYGNNGTYDISTVLFITAFFSFYLMLLVGNSILSLKNEKLEQILLLRIGQYAVSISELFFIFFLSLLVIMMNYGMPMIVNSIEDGCFIKQHISMQDNLCLLIIIWLSGITGGVIGDFFHNNIIKDRRMVVLITMLIAVLTISKEAIVGQIQCTRYIFFMLPPLNEIILCINSTSGLIVFRECCFFILKMAAYVFIVFNVKCFILNKKLYD